MTASEHTELLPCPFCGQSLQATNGGSIFVHPKAGSDAETCVIASYGMHRNDAQRIAAWNRRPIPDGAEPVPVALLDANEIWEFLYGRLKGCVPDDLSDEVLADLAAHIREHFIGDAAKVRA